MAERKRITQKAARKYRMAGRKEKGRMLDELVELTDLNRHYLAMKLREYGRNRLVADGAGGHMVLVPRERRKRTSATWRIYDEKLTQQLIRLWECFGYLCGKRLAPLLRDVVPLLRRQEELACSEQVARQLMQVSPATIDRLLAPERERLRLKGKGRGHTKPSSKLRAEIPVVTWHDLPTKTPGHFQIDLVGHDGGTAFGEFCFTLNATDLSSGWVEPRPLLNKAQRWTVEQVLDIVSRCPFPVLSLHSDNGSEFLNHFLQGVCRDQGIAFRRARSSRHNDTCYIEQKNFTVVRQSVGYGRFDTEEEVALLGQLYQTVRLYVNFFIPSMKLLERQRDGAKVARRHDVAKTPYLRLLANPNLSAKVKGKLRLIHRSLNPLELKRTIDRLQTTLITRAGTKDLSRITPTGPTRQAKIAHDLLFARRRPRFRAS